MTKQLAAALLLLLASLAATSTAIAGKTLRPFASDAEITRLFATWKAKMQPLPTIVAKPKLMALPAPPPAVVGQAAPSAPMAATTMESKSLDKVAAAGEPLKSGSITNVQTQGVDEGDIVKQHGDYLVVLRRGRLFTIRIGGDALRPVCAVNAYAPDADPDGTWYDEMLIADGRIVVIGYSYARGGTEIGLFDLDDRGRIAYRATYQMRSNDYYSSRNYASRLIGHQLVFYSPLGVSPYATDPFIAFPAVRRWRAGSTAADFHRILPATRVYRSGADLDPAEGVALHSVSVCDLDGPVMQCRSTAVLGPPGRVFYVSGDAVYVWTRSWMHRDAGGSSVFRIPLDGHAPSGLRTTGSPIDPMSFLQQGGFLNVLLNREGNGEGMWAANGAAWHLALLRVPLSDFGDGSAIAPRADYRVMPAAGGAQYGLQNRYVGDWMIFGSAGSDIAHAFRFASAGAVETVRLGHPVERIDALGNDAIVVGSRGSDLHFTSLALRRDATRAGTYVQHRAAQGDQRTHGFFYRPDGDDAGIVGLPIVRGDDGSAAVLYLRNLALRLSRMGSLASRGGATVDDACRASCVDWYGNARPIFVGDRIFALLGYELVEGRIDRGAITERRRADFAPGAKVAIAR